VGQAFAASRTARLKVGTGVSVLPGRHPVLVAKQLHRWPGSLPAASFRSSGSSRPEPPSGSLPGARRPRAAVFDESLMLVRRLLTEERVTFTGEFFTLEQASTGLLPGKPLDLWLGGSAPARAAAGGPAGDGWLGSLLTPEECAAAIAQISRRRPTPAGSSIPSTSGSACRWPRTRPTSGCSAASPSAGSDIDPRLVPRAGGLRAGCCRPTSTQA
jgi:alkanesulfonate monooxygenase SsuD/methylene tetrahydromethanopterin reductase-like flavin-dependent oxidoreductase (luciferase family)